MEHLFFTPDGGFDTTVRAVFGVLGVSSPSIGESKNVLGERYGEARILGMKIRLEENSYDYEDEFRFMLSLKSDPLEGVTIREDDITLVARVVRNLLVDNLGLVVGLEVGSSLDRLPPRR